MRGVGFNGDLNESFTAERQEEIIRHGTEGVHSINDLRKAGARGVMDYKPLFTAGELTNLDGIYMNNHEALNYMWGRSMAYLNDQGVSGTQLNWTLTAA